MITPWQIYWLTRLDGIDTILGLIIAVGLLSIIGLSLFWAMFTFDENEEVPPKLAKVIKRIFLLIIPVVILCALTPTTKQMAAIIVVPKIANSETVAELGDGIKTLAVEWMEELRPKKEVSK